MCVARPAFALPTKVVAGDGIGKHTHCEPVQARRTEVDQLIRTGDSQARTNTRARILLLGGQSQGQKRTDQKAADAVLCSTRTVIKERRRCLMGASRSALYDNGWPNIAECELSVPARQCLDRRIPDKVALEYETNAWQAGRNAARVRVNCTNASQSVLIAAAHFFRRRCSHQS